MMIEENIVDLKERKEALDPTRSFIVQAPAGSGKTELLMQRLLLLLARVEKPEQVLAITFTRKAAKEMRSRVMDSLMKARDGRQPENDSHRKTLELAGKVLKTDSRLNWNLLENPGRLKVQTIDSFCALLVRQMPLLSGLGKQPLISKNPEDLYKKAARHTIALIEEDGKQGKSVREVLRHLDNSMQGMEKRLVMMLAKRDQWLRHVYKGIDEDEFRNMLESSIKNVIEDTLKGVKEAFPLSRENKLTMFAKIAASNLLAQKRESRITKLDNLNGLPGTKATDLSLWQGICELLITSGNTWRKQANVRTGFPTGGKDEKNRKKEFQEYLESLSENDLLLGELENVRKLPDPSYSEEDWNVLCALLNLLPIADESLKQVFSEEGMVDFQAVTMAALEALGDDDNPTDLMLALDNRLRHILIDEYQDTSRTHLELLKSLTRGWEREDGRTLFIVGDPMQSIYLFREAEVGLFLDAQLNSIGSVELTPLTLKSNFRSSANIVQWIDESFRRAFPDKEDIFTGSIRYSPFYAVYSKMDGSEVKTRLYEIRDDENEAIEIAKTLKGIRKNETRAVLVRSRSHLKEIVSVFKEEEIEFRAQEIDPLMDRPVIQDIFVLLRALIHPYDRTAWLAILRAPWCGLTMHDIYKICSGDAKNPVWKLINNNDCLKSLSVDGKKRLLFLAEKLRTALPLNGRVSQGELLEGLWIDLGGPACYEDDNSMKDAEEFFEMVDSMSVGGNISSLKILVSRLETLYANQRGQGKQPVEVMTIHKAKGLEFDHVIIPGLGKEPYSSEKNILFWMERGEDLLLAPIEKKSENHRSALYQYMSGLQRKKELLEQTRLFYVAATRARKNLYLFGHIKGISPDKISTSPKTFLSAIECMLKPDLLENKKTDHKGDSPGSAEKKIPVLKLKRLPSSWKTPEFCGPVQAETKEVKLQAEDPVFYWARENTRHLGTVIHRYLSRIVQEGLLKWNKQRVIKEKKHIDAMLRQLGLNRVESQEMANKGIDILCKTLEEEKGRWILKDHHESSVELPLTGVINRKIISVVIDRTFIDEKGTRWIIDYKTGFHEGGSLQDFLKSERERYEDQLERYAAIFAAGVDRLKIKKGLYYPVFSGWIGW